MTRRWFVVAAIAIGGFASGVLAASRTSLPHLQTARYGAAAAAVDRTLYVVGGSGRRDFLGDIERIDLATGAVARMRGRVHPRRYLTAEAVDGKIYIVGGYDTAGRLVPHLEIYDPATDRVTRGPEIPTPRYFASSAVLGGMIYVAGGSFLGGETRPTAIVEVFDVASGRWADAPPLSTARQVELVEAKGRLYAIGGYDGARATRVFESFDPVEGRWQRLPDLPFPISAHRAVAIGERIYTFGDYYEMDRVWVYDTRKAEWDVVSTDYRPARHAAAVGMENAAILVGGNVSTAGTFLDDVQVIPLGRLESDSRPAGVGPWRPAPRNLR